MRFPDRRSAGVALGEELAQADPAEPLILALPRGGVPVGYEAAKVLVCPMDVLVVRKIGVPMQPELAMGALGEGVVVRNEEIVRAAGVSERMFDLVAGRELQTLESRAETYRLVAEPVDPKGHTAIVVDDGLATGSTAAAAIAVLRKKGVEEVWLAVPVAPSETVEDMARLADRVVAVAQPVGFGAVGMWYDDFTQTSDEEVEDLLSRSRLR